LTTQLQAIETTKKWLSEFVIHYNLCPFAKKPFVQDKIRYVPYVETSLDELAILVQQELLYLADVPKATAETSIIILPNVLADFYAYLDFLEAANSLIFALRLEGVLQIASFHPDYQFAGTHKSEASNFTNRSPYPLLHLLREDSITEALAHYDEPETIPQRNMELMYQLLRAGKLEDRFIFNH